MRYFLLFWLLPVGGLVAWLYMAENDLSFGMHFFSRDMYDLVFGIYGQILGVDPASLPPLIYNALVVDTLIVSAIFAFRRRNQILGWWKSRGYSARLQLRVTSVVAAGPIHPAE